MDRRPRWITLLSLVTLFIAPSLVAQQSPTGRVAGRVVDAATGAPIPGSQVTLEGTPIAAIADWAGRYLLNGAPIGTHTISVRMIGYRPKTVTGVMVVAAAATPLDVTLAAAAIEIAAVEVSVDEERGSVAQALNEQRNSNGIINAITAEQIQKSPDSDAGQAVQRVSGVTVQDGRYVLVRGLGERYTTTSLNGARIPSPEPDRKVVPLDLFPASVLEAITTSKTFTPDQPGDFSGAQVNLRTRDFPLQHVWKLTASMGANSGALGTVVPTAPRLSSEWLGFAGAARALPGAVRNAGTLVGKTTDEVNSMIGSFRNAWTSRPNDGAPNGGFSASVGGESGALGVPLGYVGSFTYSYGQEARLGERRALAAPSSNGGLDVHNASTGRTGRASVLWGGLLNLSARVGATGRLSFNNTVTHGGDNEATRLAGHIEQFNQVLDVTRLSFTERRVRSHQLAGQHLVRGRDHVQWSVTTSAVRRLEPDRSDLAYQTVIDPVTGESQPYAWFGAPRSATRTFSDVREQGWDLAASYRHGLGESGRSAVKVGGSFKSTNRNADTRSYDVFAIGLNDAERQQPAEAIFNGTYAQEGRLSMTANAALGVYTAADRIAAGFTQLEWDASERLRIIAGVRAERARLDVASRSVGLADTTARLNDTDLLPALAAQLRLGAAHNLRLSISQTVSRPEYRELSPAPYFDVLGGQTLRGNPGLRRARVQNLDARWEWYPEPAAVLSVALFAKRFLGPIERILIQRSDGLVPEATFVNATAADNYGLELELRHSLGVLTERLTPLMVFANATLMRSEIRPGNDSLSSLTNARRPMVGQSAYVVNAGLTYTNASGRLSGTVLYNTAGRRIAEAAIHPLPDVYEEARHVVDASLHVNLAAQVAVKLDGKNLLDTPVRFTQGPVERLYYRSGRVYSLGISWTR